MKRLGALAVACLLLAACGGATLSKTQPSPPAPASRCIPGNSFMGCALPAPQLGARNLSVPAGPKFVGGSDWQPSVDWHAVKASGIFAVVVKAGEGLHEDPTYATHLAGARAAGLQVMAYWFVRPVGCTSEIAAINHVVASGIRVVLDEEVPGISGYASCLSAPVASHTGIVPVIYTSPGTWPGGSHNGLSLWQAEYGPTLHPAWTPVVAWQYTESATVPGIGLSDESVDMGLFPKPAPLNPVCITHRITRTMCVYNKAHIAQDQRAAASSQRAYTARGCAVLSQRVSWYSARLREHPKIKTASRRRALTASQTAYRQRSCSTFAQRAAYFNAAAVKLRNAT